MGLGSDLEEQPALPLPGPEAWGHGTSEGSVTISPQNPQAWPHPWSCVSGANTLARIRQDCATPIESGQEGKGMEEEA